MTTLVELNTFADGVVSYTENRPSFVFFNFPNATDLTSQSISSQTFTLQRTIDIVEIVKPSIALVVFEVDVSALSGTTVSFGSLPSGVTVTELNGVFTVSGIDSVSDWEAVRSPTITLPSADHQGSFAYTCKIIATIDGVRTTKQWTVGTFKTIASFGATSSLTFVSEPLIKGASSHMIAAINVGAVEVEFAILARFSVDVTATTTKDLQQTLSVVTSMSTVGFNYPGFNNYKGFSHQGGFGDTHMGRGLTGGKYGIAWAGGDTYPGVSVNTDATLTSVYANASSTEITNGVFGPDSGSSGYSGGSGTWNINNDSLQGTDAGPTELNGFVNAGTGIFSGYYYGFVLGVKNNKFYGAQWYGPNARQLYFRISDSFSLINGQHKNVVINTATSKILCGYDDRNVPQIKGMGLYSTTGSSSFDDALAVVDWFGQTTRWDTSTNSNFNLAISDFTGMTRFDAVGSCFEYYAVVGQKPVGSGTGSMIIIRDASDGSAVTTITGPSGKTFDRLCINSEYVGVSNSSDSSSGTMVFRISDGTAMLANATTCNSLSMSDLIFATGSENSTVNIYRIPDFQLHKQVTNPNLNTSSAADKFGKYVVAKDDFVYVSAEDEDQIVDPTSATVDVGVIYRYE